MNENPGGGDSSAVPAGWYPDDAGGQRWWDGQQWTEHYAPAEQAVQTQLQDPATDALQLQDPAAHAPQVQDPAAQAPRRKMPRTTKIVLIAAVATVAALGVATAATVPLLLSSNNDQPTSTEAAKPAPTQKPDTSDEEEYSTPDFNALFEERDQFMQDQQQPIDGSLLAAKTPAQQAFVAEARAQVEQNGGVWDVQTESIALALALDACEGSILNGHTMTVETVRLHAATSPLIGVVAGSGTEAQRTEIVAGLMKLVVTGTSHLCPADSAQWSSAVGSIGSDW
ncbi:DUF2510 domain-containing protein [Leucobacter insecticola]|uniref:DUF2510 domain-containing protein n=1 Tax=Leucobacter insecticola TaxID=2714934 RepID=A0A6G8FKR4_9MICO|nr:DUF2510 domain-containing protein [Leucobacter insecticola]QIM16879.1 DUF2510 domain-containing protein [Leucobacter insecticola]